MIKLVSKDKCTGCGACSYICPKGCIEMKENDMHELLPVINAYMCVECGKCVKICPVLNPVETYVPIEAYAARSNDKKEAFNSASGGIARLYIVTASKKMPILQVLCRILILA